MRLVYSLVTLAVIGATGYVGLNWVSLNSSVPETIQKILDDNVPGNTLKVAYVKVPLTAAIPYVGPAKSDGYLMVEKKDGGKMPIDNCALEAIDYELREAAHDQFAISISGEEMFKVRACQ